MDNNWNYGQHSRGPYGGQHDPYGRQGYAPSGGQRGGYDAGHYGGSYAPPGGYGHSGYGQQGAFGGGGHQGAYGGYGGHQGGHQGYDRGGGQQGYGGTNHGFDRGGGQGYGGPARGHAAYGGANSYGAASRARQVDNDYEHHSRPKPAPAAHAQRGSGMRIMQRSTPPKSSFEPSRARATGPPASAFDDASPPASPEPPVPKTRLAAKPLPAPTVPSASVSVKPAQAKSKPKPKETREQKEPKGSKPKPKANAAEKKAVKKSKRAKINLADLKVHDERDILNIVFIGHVDAGKSTISGQILLQTDQIDQRTIEKFEREAKDKNRESWWIAYIMDENEEERAKGKTVELGRAHFETSKKRYTILDAPGHKLYVPEMILAAQQADVGVLIVSARKGEFEAGFEGGQTMEHSMLAFTLGITRLVVVVNKMDEKTVKWAKERYDEIKGKLKPFLKDCGYKVEKNVVFLPVSAQLGLNIAKSLDSSTCAWYKGKCLLDTLDDLKKIKRGENKSLRSPVDVFDVEGKQTCVGKIASGTLYVGQRISLMPDNYKAEVLEIKIDKSPAQMAKCGEHVTMLVKYDSDVARPGGYMLCNEEDPCPKTKIFEAQINLQDLNPHTPVMAVGYQAMLHVNNVTTPCEIEALLHMVQKKTGKYSRKPPTYIKKGSAAIVRIKVGTYIALENFDDYSDLGRFTLRDEGKTIAIGKVLEVNKDRFGKLLQRRDEKAKAAEKKKKEKKAKKCQE